MSRARRVSGGAVVKTASEICDDHFLEALSSDLLGGVWQLDAPCFELAEDLADLGCVVQGENEVALEETQSRGHLHKVIVLKVVPVELATVIWRVEVEERLWAIKMRQKLLVRQTLNLYTRQAFVGLFDEFWNTLRVEAGRLHDMALVAEPQNQARVAVLQEIEMASRTLYVGQCCGIRVLQQFMPFAAYDDEAEITDQFLEMLLADTEEIHDLAVQIVQDLNRRRFFVKEHLGSPGEDLNVRRMFGEDRNDVPGERTFAANVAEGPDHGGFWRWR